LIGVICGWANLGILLGLGHKLRIKVKQAYLVPSLKKELKSTLFEKN